jgi:hypothetical protein
MKRYLLIALILLVLITAILLRFPIKSVPLEQQETVNGTTLKEERQTNSTNTVITSKPRVVSLLPKKTMTTVDYKIDSLALRRERENPPFEFRGGAGTGRIIDRQGRVLMESSEEYGIFGTSVSPDRKKVLVDAANSKGGNCLVLEPEADRLVKLPPRPPSENMFSLSWYWIGPNLLFGISGVEKVFPVRSHGHGNCCNDNNVAQTKFYTFDLLTEQLSEVAMPSEVTQPIVNVLDVTSDGHIHLQHETPQEGIDPDLGWFKIDTGK